MGEFEKLYTVDDIAKLTMLTTRTIRKYLKDGLLTGQKSGRPMEIYGREYCKIV